MSGPGVTMEVKPTSKREPFTSWPSDLIATKAHYLGPRALGGMRSLNNSANPWTYTDMIISGLDTAAMSGRTPAVSQLLEPVVPVTAWMLAIDVIHGVVYQSSSLSPGIKLRGVSKLNIWITPSLAQAEVVAYLYDVDSTGTVTLITHGPISFHTATPGKAIQLSVELKATSYDVPAGHKLAIAIDTFDPLCGVPTTDVYSGKFPLSSGQQSILTVQYER
jgi:predicted acyl esterase